jgi:hypothetical protein
MIKPKRLSSHPFHAYSVYRKRFSIQKNQNDLQDQLVQQNGRKTQTSMTKRNNIISSNNTTRTKYRSCNQTATIDESPPLRMINNSVDLPKVRPTTQHKNPSMSPNFPFNLNFLVQEIKRKRIEGGFRSQSSCEPG